MTQNLNTPAAEIEMIEAAIVAAEVEEILAGEDNTMPVENIAEALAQANGSDEALNAAADEAVDEDEALEDDGEEVSFEDLLTSVTDTEITEMQTALTAAFAERARFEREANPNNDNIQKTLTKVQRGHLAHGISKALVAVELSPDYLNKSEVANKRRNVYALEKLQDIIYGAATGSMKNAINIATLVSMVRLEAVKIPFTGAIAKACASDKIAIETNLKGLLRRHTVAEGTASTQSSSTMTALEDLGVVTNTGTAKFPIWSMTSSPLAKRLVEVVRSKHMGVSV